MTEIRADDLRFNSDEAKYLFTRISGVELNSDELEILMRSEEGRAVGIQLAGIFIRGKRDAAALMRSLASSNRYVLDYLAEEALINQPDQIQNFLINTSIYPGFVYHCVPNYYLKKSQRWIVFNKPGKHLNTWNKPIIS